MRKIVAIQYGYVHYHAGCSSGCDFSDAIGDGRKPAQVRKAVIKHVRETGHECWIESGKHTAYRREAVEQTREPDAVKASESKSETHSSSRLLS
jgi:hypothetical protein